MEPFYCRYTKANLVAGAASLEVELSMRDNKETLINELCKYPDQDEMRDAVAEAAGE